MLSKDVRLKDFPRIKTMINNSRIVDVDSPSLDTFRNGDMDLVSIFVFVRSCIHNHISDMYGPILFVHGKNTKHDGMHMYIILFHDVIKDGRLASILL